MRARAGPGGRRRRHCLGQRRAAEHPGCGHPGAGAPDDRPARDESPGRPLRAGYVDDNSTGNTYRKVAGQWTEPAVTCGQEDQIVIFFVGIDGWNSSTVEQAGTFAQCYQGAAHYYSWWEMYPSNAIQVVGSTVKPGDKIAASVVRTGTSYAIKVTDSTTAGNTFSRTKTCATCANSSAEWIAEAPSNASGVLPLANFGTWTLKGAAVTAGTAGTISSFPDSEITMVNSAMKVKAQPGPLNSTGTQFKVTWKSAT